MAQIVAYHISERSATGDRGGNESLTEKHTVVVDSPVSVEWIARHNQTPKENGAVLAHPGFFWDSVSRKQVAKLIWEIDCSASRFEFLTAGDDPLAEPARISIDSELISEPTLTDYKGRPLVNRAGEFIAEQTVERPLLVYRVAKNLGSDPLWLDDYPGAVNRDPVRLRGRVRRAGTLMLRRVSLSEYSLINRTSVTACTFELHYDPRGWVKRLLNVGTVQLLEFTTAAGKKIWQQERILTGKPPVPVDAPVPLDIRGQVIDGVLDPEGDSPVDVSKLVVLSYDVQPLKTFTGVLPLQ